MFGGVAEALREIGGELSQRVTASWYYKAATLKWGASIGLKTRYLNPIIG
jgi:hypothetical protein